MKIPFKKELAGKFKSDEFEHLDRRALHAVLATCAEDVPHTSLVAYAYDKKEKQFIFLTPKKTTKFINIRRNPNVSLLIHMTKNNKSDYMRGLAYTVAGCARGIRLSKKRDRLMRIFLKKHPRLLEFSKQNEIALVTLTIKFSYKVGQFQKVYYLE